MKKFIICFQDVFYYTSWFNINAKSLNELIYFSTCRREVFNTDTAAKEKISEIKELADNNLIMPPKSTYIDPKFRSGLVVYEL